VPTNPQYEEALAQTAIRRICKGSRRKWIPLEVEAAMRQQEAEESRARIAREKEKWLDSVKIPR
jgi:hypothetical protein